MDENEEYILDPENEIPINTEELDVEFLRQSGTYNLYAKAAAVAAKAAKTAHENVKVLRSQLTKEATLDPETYLGPGIKATGPIVEAYYRAHPDHIAAKKALIEAEFESEILQGAKSAVYMRKFALEGLLRLATMGWFSSPKEPRSFEDIADRVASVDDKTAERKVRIAMDKKRAARKMTRGPK